MESATESTAAVIVAAPSHTARTKPVESTTATAVSLDDHVSMASAMANPFASSASAANLTVSSGDSSASAGVTTTTLATCSTVAVAVPVTEPAVAVTTTSPLPTDRTRAFRVHRRHRRIAARPGHRGVGHEVTVLVVHLRREPRGVLQSRELQGTGTYGYPCRLGRVRRDRLVAAARQGGSKGKNDRRAELPTTR